MSNVLSKFEQGDIQTGYRNLIANFGSYVELARDVAYEQSESHREFEVGAVGVAIRPGSGDLVTVVGANLKIKHPHDEELDEEIDPELAGLHEEFEIPRSVPKFCAEMATIMQSEGKDLFFVAEVIAATTDPEEIAGVTNGIQLQTLPPCEDACLPVLDNSPATSRATLYVSAGLDRDIFQVRNMRMLKNLYRTRRETGVAIGSISVQNTALSLGYFDQRVAAHDFSNGLPARVISSFTRQALTYPSTLR